MNVTMLDLAGDIHWKCHSRCERLIEDMHRLRRDESGEIDTRNPRLGHASDAEGYRVAFLRGGALGNVPKPGRFSVGLP